MPWRSSFPCHRVCCGPDTLLWFALSVFRVADMIGIVGHVSFLPPTKKRRHPASLAALGATWKEDCHTGPCFEALAGYQLGALAGYGCASLRQRHRVHGCTARSRPDRQVTPAHIAARVLAAARDRMRRDWLLVGSDIRLRAGVLSHWLRGRQPAMTQEQFQQRWCHGDALCSLPGDVQEPPIIHWTAMHPVPLPQ